MAPYPIFFRALKTIILPNFMLLTESEQLKHISALLLKQNGLIFFFVFITQVTLCFTHVLSTPCTLNPSFHHNNNNLYYYIQMEN